MYHSHRNRARVAAISAGLDAARMLQECCRRVLERRSSPQLELVRGSALDLGSQLDVLSDGTLSADLLAEGALRCADAANLAACAVPELPDEERPPATAATHLAAGAARALHPLVEAAAIELEGDRAEYVLRDARSAAWRADLAVRQVDEL